MSSIIFLRRLMAVGISSVQHSLPWNTVASLSMLWNVSKISFLFRNFSLLFHFFYNLSMWSLLFHMTVSLFFIFPMMLRFIYINSKITSSNLLMIPLVVHFGTSSSSITLAESSLGLYFSVTCVTSETFPN